MMLSRWPWWCAPVLALGCTETVPAQSLLAPALAKSIAAARVMPGVCGVLKSSSDALTMRTPCVRQSGLSAGSVIPTSNLVPQSRRPFAPPLSRRLEQLAADQHAADFGCAGADL